MRLNCILVLIVLSFFTMSFVSCDESTGRESDNLLARRTKDAKAPCAQIYIDFGARMSGDGSFRGGAQNGKSANKYIASIRTGNFANKRGGAFQ